jgi:hypothetical protein
MPNISHRQTIQALEKLKREFRRHGVKAVDKIIDCAIFSEDRKLAEKAQDCLGLLLDLVGAPIGEYGLAKVIEKLEDLEVVMYPNPTDAKATKQGTSKGT